MIPDVSQSQIMDAIAQFDRELRDNEEWIGWEDISSQLYALVHGDRRYPPKHILHLATGTPKSEFSGGEAETNKYLRKKGFNVIKLPGNRVTKAATVSKYVAWFCQATSRYDVNEYLKRYDYIYWSVNQHKNDIRIGDPVFIWRSLNASQGREYGAIALGHVAETATDKENVARPNNLADELWSDAVGDTDLPKVGIQIDPSDVRLDTNSGMLLADELKAIPEVSQTRILRNPTGTVFGITEPQFEKLNQLWSGELQFPFTSYSWVIHSPTLAVKQMDKSAFLHHGTGVPREITYFFEFDSRAYSKPVTLIHRNIRYKAHLSPDVENQRVRLFWQAPLSNLIAKSQTL